MRTECFMHSWRRVVLSGLSVPGFLQRIDRAPKRCILVPVQIVRIRRRREVYGLGDFTQSAVREPDEQWCNPADLFDGE